MSSMLIDKYPKLKKRKKLDEVDVRALEKAIEDFNGFKDNIDERLLDIEDKVDSIKPDNGYTPIKGVDYFDGETPDIQEIIKEVTKNLPKTESSKVDEDKIIKKVLKSLPNKKGDLKIIQEKVEVDPMSVIDKIMSLPPEKFKIKLDNIDGLQQTINAFKSQLGRGYLHGSGPAPLTTKGDIYTYSTLPARLPVGVNNQVLIANSSTITGLEWINFAPGGVVSVSGTPDRITSTGGANPIIDIDAGYIGQTSISTVGSVNTGTWLATRIGLAYGGTNADLASTGGTGQYLKQSSVGAAITVGIIPASDIGSGEALTKTDDTNVTLTLGGTPTTALLKATSLTLGWAGVLGETRGGTNQSTYTLGNILYASAANTLSKLAGNTTTSYKALTQVGTGSVSAAPVWNTIREQLTGNRTYYVRTDGSNSNTGLVNNAGGAFLTIQKAIDTVSMLDISIFNVTIQVGDGTYTASLLVNGPWLGSGVVTLVGNTGTPANVIVTSSTSDTLRVIRGGTLLVSGTEFRGTGGQVLRAESNGYIEISTSVRFGAATNSHLYAELGGVIYSRTSYTISGGGTSHIATANGGEVDVSANTVTLSGTPAFSVAYAVADRLSGIQSQLNTFSGSATGPRYSVNLNSVIFTNGGGANYFPGNSAGAATNGGQYA